MLKTLLDTSQPTYSSCCVISKLLQVGTDCTFYVAIILFVNCVTAYIKCGITSITLLVTVICKCTVGQTLQSSIAEDNQRKLNQKLFHCSQMFLSDQIVTQNVGISY